jgi:hypothetical protein
LNQKTKSELIKELEELKRTHGIALDVLENLITLALAYDDLPIRGVALHCQAFMNNGFRE